jgi:hypothetical protein
MLKEGVSAPLLRPRDLLNESEAVFLVRQQIHDRFALDDESAGWSLQPADFIRAGEQGDRVTS